MQKPFEWDEGLSPLRPIKSSAERRKELVEKYKEQPKLSLRLRNFKIWEGFEYTDDGFSATLYVNNKRAVRIIKDVFGDDDLHYDWVKPEYEELLEAYVAFLPLWHPEDKHGFALPTNLDLLVWYLIDELKIWQACKTQTVINLGGEVFTVKQPFTPEIKAQLIQQYGDRIEAFMNEELQEKYGKKNKKEN